MALFRCSVCHQELSDSQFSKNQMEKKRIRKCKNCIGFQSPQQQDKFTNGTLVLVTGVKEGISWPGQVGIPFGRESVYSEKKYFVHLFGHTNRQWVDQNKITLYRDKDMEMLEGFSKKLTGPQLDQFNSAICILKDCLSKATPFSLLTVPVYIKEEIPVDLLPTTSIYGDEVKNTILNELSKKTNTTINDVNIMAYVPVDSQKDPKIQDLSNNHGILLAADHISPLADQVNLRKTISENIAQIQELQNQMRVPPQAPLSTGTMPEEWQNFIKRLENKFEEAERARAIAEEERAHTFAEAEKERAERDGIIANLIKQYSTPFNKILIGGLIYMARDKVIYAYKDACSKNFELPQLQNDQDIFSENFAVWVSQYLDKNTTIDIENMSILMQSKMKRQRDEVAHNPNPKQVGAAISTIRGDKKRELFSSLFHFVFPNEILKW